MGDITAIAFKVAALLESYQMHLERLGSDWRNGALCRSAGALLDKLGGLLAALPQLAVDMVEIVVGHTSLLHLLHAGGAQGDVLQLQRRHLDALSNLRRKTLRLLCDPAASR
ncbi:MAG: hypothetical protein M3150_05555 [Pseudomonadota bacterium]|nr:hypothetical protein [Pseudomonadota bacterium]